MWSPPGTSMYSWVMPSFFICSAHGRTRSTRTRASLSPCTRMTGRCLIFSTSAAGRTVAEEVDAVRVDRVLLADEVQDVHHVLLAQFRQVLRVALPRPAHRPGAVPP